MVIGGAANCIGALSTFAVAGSEIESPETVENGCGTSICGIIVSLPRNLGTDGEAADERSGGDQFEQTAASAKRVCSCGRPRDFYDSVTHQIAQVAVTHQIAQVVFKSFGSVAERIIVVYMDRSSGPRDITLSPSSYKRSSRPNWMQRICTTSATQRLRVYNFYA